MVSDPMSIHIYSRSHSTAEKFSENIFCGAISEGRQPSEVLFSRSNDGKQQTSLKIENQIFNFQA